MLPTIPREQRTRVAHFLEKQGFKSQAMAVTCDPEHKFELAIQLGDLKISYTLAKEAEVWSELSYETHNHVIIKRLMGSRCIMVFNVKYPLNFSLNKNGNS